MAPVTRTKQKQSTSSSSEHSADTFEDEKVAVEDLKASDHIIIPGSSSGSSKDFKGSAAYFHHGVYLGIENGLHWVTDFGAVNKTEPVKRELNEFLGSNGENNLRRRKYLSTEVIPAEQTLAVAKKIFKKKVKMPYNPLLNNCEHYASMLKLGTGYSHQAERALKFVQELTKLLLLKGLNRFN